jgi:hypothetical protein
MVYSNLPRKRGKKRYTEPLTGYFVRRRVYTLFRSRDSVVYMVSTARVGRPRNLGTIPYRYKTFLPSKATRPTWDPARLQCNGCTRLNTRAEGGEVAKRPGREADHPLTSSKEVKNECSCNSTRQNALMVCCEKILHLPYTSFCSLHVCRGS